MSSSSTIGDRELELLRYLEKRKDASVGEAAAEFGEPRGLARSTVLTMMGRLRTKGFLKRHRAGRVFRYSTSTRPGEVVRHAVGSFVEKRLGGSISPFVAWMAERGEISDTELAELRELVAQLGTGRKEK
jgi:predicted transcriptional regulator